MKTDIIFSENGQEFVIMDKVEKIELVNPIKYIQKCEIKQCISNIKGVLFSKNRFMAENVPNIWYIKKAIEELNKKTNDKRLLNTILNTKVNENYIKLIQSERKRDQEKLLKGLNITTNEMMNLFCIAYKDYGFLYSFYTFEILPKGYENKRLPKIANHSNGNISKIGNTDLTDGEIKQLIENRKVIIAHFIEKDEVWHCFLFTYKSMKGQESWEGGQAHLHYVSSSYNFSKEQILEKLRNGEHPSLSIHIPIMDYGNQTITARINY